MILACALDFLNKAYLAGLAVAAKNVESALLSIARVAHNHKN